METSLHRALKARYAAGPETLEVRVGGYRIDAVCKGELVEIQHGSLAALRDKVRRLLPGHRVRVVKPIVAGKFLVKRGRKGGPVVDRRLSPKRGCLHDLFEELVYFTRVYPHPLLTLEVLLVEIEEWRYPGHGRRRRWRAGDYVVEDQKLLAVHAAHEFRTPGDLCRLLPDRLPQPFHTGELAEALGIPRWTAQKAAYCLRKTGAALAVGKRGNAWLYELTSESRAA